jgi:perosamine synthetase
MKKISIANPILDRSDINNAYKVLKSGWISSRGEFVSKFEKKFQNFFKGGFPLSVSNGTSALELAIKSLGIKKGDEIIAPNFTFAASVNAIINCNAKPVLVDVEEHTWTISLNEIKRKITKKTRAIIMVHIFGQPCKIDEIKNFAKKKKIFLIEDCAESLGAKYKGRLVGLDGDCSCHSFYANKTITTGEGGMVVFKKKNFFNKAKIIKNHGMSKKKYFHEYIGSNYRLTNIQAAIGCAQMNKINKLILMRKKIFENYDNLLSDKLFYKIHRNNWSINSYWLYYLIIKKKVNRAKIIKKLSLKGIEVSPTFYPLNTMKIYKKYASGSFKNSEKIGLNGICLPSSGLSLDQQKYIVKSLLSIIKT